MKGAAGPGGAGTGPDWGACAVGDSLDWAELGIPSAAEAAFAGKPVANWLLSLHSWPAEAGLFVPCFLAASAACDAAFAAAAAGDTRRPGAAETGCGWPSPAPAPVPLPAAAAGGAAAPSSGAVSSGDLGTGEPSPSDSYSSAAPEDSSQPWPAAAAAAAAAGACWVSALLLAWGSCSAWPGWGAPLPAALAWPAAAAAPAAPAGGQAAPPWPAGSASLRTWPPAA